MVGSVVNGVHTNSVDAKALELLNVALATSGIGNRVLSIRSTACPLSVSVVNRMHDSRTRLVVDTADVETLIASEESCRSLAKGSIFSSICWGQTISFDSDG